MIYLICDKKKDKLLEWKLKRILENRMCREIFAFGHSQFHSFSRYTEWICSPMLEKLRETW